MLLLISHVYPHSCARVLSFTHLIAINVVIIVTLNYLKYYGYIMYLLKIIAYFESLVFICSVYSFTYTLSSSIASSLFFANLNTLLYWYGTMSHYDVPQSIKVLPLQWFGVKVRYHVVSGAMF